MSIKPVVADAWTHVAIVRQQGIMRLYINGVLSNEYDNKSPTFHANQHAFRFGSRLPPSGNHADVPFIGKIDGSFYFYHALNNQNILKLFFSRLGCKEAIHSLHKWLQDLQLENLFGPLFELGASSIQSLGYLYDSDFEELGLDPTSRFLFILIT